VSIHSSFRTSGNAAKHRNVLTRLERLEKLEAAERWNSAEDGLFGMPKVRSIKVAMKKKKKKGEEEETPAKK
jgi:small basic protein (TIGR04137 family)